MFLAFDCTFNEVFYTKLKMSRKQIFHSNLHLQHRSRHPNFNRISPRVFRLKPKGFFRASSQPIGARRCERLDADWLSGKIARAALVGEIVLVFRAPFGRGSPQNGFSKQRGSTKLLMLRKWVLVNEKRL